MMKLLNKQKGFTLMELLIAASILVFTLVGLLALFITCTFLNRSNRNLTIATTHAEQILEEISLDFYSIVGNYNNTWNSAAIPVEWPSLTANSLLDNESIVISSAYVSSDTSLLDIRVTVTWIDRRVSTTTTNTRSI
ncbi:MAG: type II secretion system protein, partial [Candidatus Omnitrophota bacterium]